MVKNEFVCDCNIIHQDIVDKITEQMPESTIFNNLAEFFKLIGDPTRLKILFALDKEEVCVCDIANTLSMSKSSISHQLALLKKYEIIKSRKQGKEVYYTLDDEHVNEVFEIELKHINHKNKERGNLNETKI